MAITQISKSGMDALWLARKQGSAIFRVAYRRAGHSNLGTRPNVPFLNAGLSSPSLRVTGNPEGILRLSVG
jgi:hypothetical protein